MASPRTRRVLAELRPKDDNNVSKSLYFAFFETLLTDVLGANVSFFRDVLNAEATTLSG